MKGCVETDLASRAQPIVDALRSSGRSVVTAESCTGGLVAAVLSHAESASECLHGGFVRSLGWCGPRAILHTHHPAREQPKCAAHIHSASRYPHDEPSELLILQRCERGGGLQKLCIPGPGCECNQRTEHPGMERGSEQVHDSGTSLAGSPCFEQGGPEEQRPAKKGQVLQVVNARTRQRGIEEQRYVPHP